MNLAVINDSTQSGLSDAQVADLVAGINVQVQRDFCPRWSLRCSLRFVPTGRTAPKGYGWIKVTGTSDEPGALGYHTETPEGLPVGYIFTQDDAKYGADPGITLSHEVLETLLDPKIADAVYHQGQTDEFHAKEACDAVEADVLGYIVTLTGGKQVLVSDFVLPDYFDDTAPGRNSKQYDFMGHLTAPFSLASGGYQSVYVPGSGWIQRSQRRTAQLAAEKGPLSRMALRIAKSDAGIAPKYGARHPELAKLVERTNRLVQRR